MAETGMVNWNKSSANAHWKRWSMKIGRIFDLMTTPCNNDRIEMFIGAPFVNLPTLLYTLLQHECKDQLWDKGRDAWLRMNNRGGYRHGRGGTPNFKSQGEFGTNGPTPKGNGYAWIRAGDFMQRIGSYLLIIDAALNWDINWMSDALEWSGCQPEPFAWSSGELLGAVYGDHCTTIKAGCAAIGGGMNILAGIGGFSTTVPVSRLNAFGSLNCVPFGNSEFHAVTGARWRVFNAISGQQLIGTGESGTDEGTSTSKQLWSKQRYDSPTAIRMLGWYEYDDPCVGPGKGGAFGQSPYYVTADLTTSVAGSKNADPCAGMIGATPGRR